MTAAELANQIMALPAAERAAIAQRVWESIEDEQPFGLPKSDTEAIVSARVRDEEITRGDVSVRNHDDVMKNARRSIKCE